MGTAKGKGDKANLSWELQNEYEKDTCNPDHVQCVTY